jgi:polypeptide deformylase
VQIFRCTIKWKRYVRNSHSFKTFFGVAVPRREERCGAATAREVLAEGLLATVLQHEIDHLNGVLFIDHISKLKRDRVIKKFQKAAKRAGDGSHALRARRRELLNRSAS